MRTASLTEVRPPKRPAVLIEELVVVPGRCAVWKHQERTRQCGALVEARSQLRKHAVLMFACFQASPFRLLGASEYSTQSGETLCPSAEARCFSQNHCARRLILGSLLRKTWFHSSTEFEALARGKYESESNTTF